MKFHKGLNPFYLFANSALIRPALVGRCRFYFFRWQRWLRARNKIVDENDRKLVALKHKHKGRRCFILGNGPSLNIKDLDLLSDDLTFAANKIYLSFPEQSWRPTYYFVEDNLVLRQNWDVIEGLSGFPKFFPIEALKFTPKSERGLYYEFVCEPMSENFPSFGFDPLAGFYWGSTVIYSMLQFAFYMGCNPIYIAGVDFNFDLPQKPANGIELECEGEVNHFHPEYRKIGEKWNVPNLDIQAKSFTKAKAIASEHGINIYNATRGGKLEVFDRVEFESLFK